MAKALLRLINVIKTTFNISVLSPLGPERGIVSRGGGGGVFANMPVAFGSRWEK